MEQDKIQAETNKDSAKPKEAEYCTKCTLPHAWRWNSGFAQRIKKLGFIH